MKINGKAVSEEMVNDLAIYMNDEIREKIHMEMAPCDPEKFLVAYFNEDPEFKDFLERDFCFEE